VWAVNFSFFLLSQFFLLLLRPFASKEQIKKIKLKNGMIQPQNHHGNQHLVLCDAPQKTPSEIMLSMFIYLSDDFFLLSICL